MTCRVVRNAVKKNRAGSGMARRGLVDRRWGWHVAEGREAGRGVSIPGRAFGVEGQHEQRPWWECAGGQCVREGEREGGRRH